MLGTVTFISLCLQATRALQVLQPYRVVASAGEAVLRCSYVTSTQPEELRLTLLRGMYGNQMVCASSFNTSESQFEVQGSAHCLGEVRPGSVDLTMSGLKGDDTDLYRCMIEVLYPPPYQQWYGNGTLLYIPEEPACPAVAEKMKAELEDSFPAVYKLPISVLIVTIIVILIIIAVTHNIGSRKYRRELIMIPPVGPKTVDWRLGYENFL